MISPLQLCCSQGPTLSFAGSTLLCGSPWQIFHDLVSASWGLHQPRFIFTFHNMTSPGPATHSGPLKETPCHSLCALNGPLECWKNLLLLHYCTCLYIHTQHHVDDIVWLPDCSNISKKILLNCFLGTQKCLFQKSLAEWDFAPEHPSLHPSAEQEASP